MFYWSSSFQAICVVCCLCVRCAYRCVDLTSQKAKVSATSLGQRFVTGEKAPEQHRRGAPAQGTRHHQGGDTPKHTHPPTLPPPRVFLLNRRCFSAPFRPTGHSAHCSHRRPTRHSAHASSSRARTLRPRLCSTQRRRSGRSYR